MTIWIVPEPDPILALTIDKIDAKKLDYEDVRWICSSTMKQYIDEFVRLQGFIERYRLFKKYEQEIIRKKEKEKNYHAIARSYQPEDAPPIYTKPPTIFPKNSENFIENEKYIEIKTQKSLPFHKIPFLKKPRKLKEDCVIH